MMHCNTDAAISTSCCTVIEVVKDIIVIVVKCAVRIYNRCIATRLAAARTCMLIA